MFEKKIKLGDKVKCRYTGFIGIAVAKTEFLNGCVQFNILPRCKNKDKMSEEIGIDEQSLEVVPTEKKKIKKRNTGGAMTRGLKHRGF